MERFEYIQENLPRYGGVKNNKGVRKQDSHLDIFRTTRAAHM
jgi:hypothetical protein